MATRWVQRHYLDAMLTADRRADLARATGYEVQSTVSGAYRTGILAWLFPNRLEITMRWVKLS